MPQDSGCIKPIWQEMTKTRHQSNGRDEMPGDMDGEMDEMSWPEDEVQ
jgi:hypothetical protein